MLLLFSDTTVSQKEVAKYQEHLYLLGTVLLEHVSVKEGFATRLKMGNIDFTLVPNSFKRKFHLFCEIKVAAAWQIKSLTCICRRSLCKIVLM